MRLSSVTRKHFFLGVNTGFVTDNLPDCRCREFYVARSGNGLYCSIVGNVTIPEGYGSNTTTAEISASPAWRHLAEEIEAEGAVPGIQLATAWQGYEGNRKFVSRLSSSEIQRCKDVAAGVNLAVLHDLFARLHDGTNLAVRAGFRHIQLHAAHGYLFSLLIDARLSDHAAVALHEIAQWSTRLIESGIETSIRFSLRTGDRNFDENGQNEFLDKVSSLPVSFLDVSSGFYNIDKRLIYPSIEPILAARRMETLALAKRHKSAQFILSGKSKVVPDVELPANVHIGICRDLIANPNFLRDLQGGCINAMKCHYYSRNASHLTCGRWNRSS